MTGPYGGGALATPVLTVEEVRALCRPYETRAAAEAAAETAWDDGWLVAYPPVPLRRGGGDWIVASVHMPDQESHCLGDITCREAPA